jgi:hypothetical protein
MPYKFAGLQWAFTRSELQMIQSTLPAKLYEEGNWKSSWRSGNPINNEKLRSCSGFQISTGSGLSLAFSCFSEILPSLLKTVKNSEPRALYHCTIFLKQLSSPLFMLIMNVRHRCVIVTSFMFPLSRLFEEDDTSEGTHHRCSVIIVNFDFMDAPCSCLAIQIP